MGLILITIDCMRLENMTVFEEGQHFVCCSAAPITPVACTTILTGLYPPRHSVRGHQNGTLPANIPTLATIFKDAGYQTHAVVSTIALDRRYGLNRDFDTYYCPESSRISYHEAFKHLPLTCTNNTTPITAPRQHTQGRRSEGWGNPTPSESPRSLVEGKGTHGNTTAGSPSAGKLFLWLHLFDLHPRISRRKEPSARSAYAAREEIMRELAGVIKETFFGRGHRIVITGDHGQHFPTRNPSPRRGEEDFLRLGHGPLLTYEDVLTPLILIGFEDCWKPWTVRHVDLVPTICDEFGLPVPKTDGCPIKQQTEELWAYSESHIVYRSQNLHIHQSSVRKGRDFLVCGSPAVACRPISELDNMLRILNAIAKEPDETQITLKKLMELGYG